MKFSEMINAGPPNITKVDSIAPYLLKHCPDFIPQLVDTGRHIGMSKEDALVWTATLITGMDVMVRYIQEYDIPEDIGELIQEKSSD